VNGDTGETKLRLDAKSAMWGLTLSPDAAFVAIATTGSPTQVFDTRTGQRIAVGSASFGASTSAAFSPNGDLLVSTDDDTNVRAYDRKGKLLYATESGLLEPFAAAFTGDGQKFVIATADGGMSLHESASGKKLMATQSTGNPIFAIQMYPDSRHVAAFELDSFTLKPSAVGVWDMQSDHSQKLDVDPETVIGCGADRTHLLLIRQIGPNILTVDSVQ
jgi:WD40 repeat protein